MYEVQEPDHLDTVPTAHLAALAEVRAALEVSPRSVGQPYLASNPAGMRVVSFAEGRGLLVFGVSEQQRQVWLFDLVVL